MDMIKNRSDYPKNGVYENLPDEIYHAPELGVASSSAIKQILRSLAHYRAWIDGQIEAHSAALDFGRALHSAVLTPRQFSEQYCIEPDFGDMRSSQHRSQRDEWREQNSGLRSISETDSDVIGAICRSIQAHPIASTLLSRSGQSEVTMRWTDRASGCRCKSRVDRLCGKIVVDLKSCKDASRAGFRRAVSDYGYHVQAAHYLAGMRHLDLAVDDFVFVAVEKTSPFAVAVYRLDEMALMAGESACARAYAMLTRGVASDEWPSYSAEIGTLDLPSWILEQALPAAPDSNWGLT